MFNRTKQFIAYLDDVVLGWPVRAIEEVFLDFIKGNKHNTIKIPE